MADPRYEELMMRQSRSEEPMMEEPVMDEAMMGEAMMGEAMMDEAEMGAEVPEEAGRGGDVVLGHLTPGELILPAELANDPELTSQLQEAFEAAGLDMEQYVVGSEANAINPETGYPEFWSLTKMLTGKSRSQRKREGVAKYTAQATSQAKQQQAAFNKQFADLKKQMKLQTSNFRTSLAASTKQMKEQQKQMHRALDMQRAESTKRINKIQKESERKAIEAKRRAERMNVLNRRTVQAGVGAKEATAAAAASEGAVGGAGLRSMAPTTRPRMRRAGAVAVPRFARRSRTMVSKRRPR